MIFAAAKTMSGKPRQLPQGRPDGQTRTGASRFDRDLRPDSGALVDTPAALLQAVGALRKARDGDGFVLRDPAVADSLLAVLHADEISFNDLDLRTRCSTTAELLTTPVEELHRAIWDTIGCSYPEPVRRLRGEVMTTGDFCSDRQWHCTGIYADLMRPSCAGKTLVIPLPGPPGIARRLVFLRGPGRPFGEEDRSAAVLLQPHICESLRMQARREAARLLTARQIELLRLVAVGCDNCAIAKQLVVSRDTVRKHLENAYARLGVSSRTAAVARAFPDITWS
jgi:DNA-binding CsgD family transcriptional regulator